MMVANRTLMLTPFVVSEPEIDKNVMIASATRVFASAGVRLEARPAVPIQTSRYEFLNVGRCERHITEDQERLFQLRRGAEQLDIAAYFVQATLAPYSGCASHPPDTYALVVTARATQWTLGHEIGHVLGLGHSNDRGSLMYKSTSGIIGVPRLFLSEVDIIRRSPLLSEVA